MSINHSKEPRTDNPTVPEAGQAVVDGTEMVEKPCCCAVGNKQAEIVQKPPSTSEPWIVGTLDTPLGVVPQAGTILRPADHLGAWRVRLSIGRMRYKVDPGLYAVGHPTVESPVLVSANYKLSFDRLRSQLTGLDAWMEDKKARIVDRDACMECGACAKNCPVTAISVQSGVGCLTAIIRGAIRGTEPDCDCVGESTCC